MTEAYPWWILNEQSTQAVWGWDEDWDVVANQIFSLDAESKRPVLAQFRPRHRRSWLKPAILDMEPEKELELA